METTKETGKKGELLAAEYLRDKGFKIQAVNWQVKHLELDIVALFEKP